MKYIYNKFTLGLFALIFPLLSFAADEMTHPGMLGTDGVLYSSGGSGKIFTEVQAGVIALKPTAYWLSAAMIITLVATGIFSHHENVFKNVLKALVALFGLAVVFYWVGV